jgi:uncharacterized protein (TIGR02001 family)
MKHPYLIAAAIAATVPFASLVHAQDSGSVLASPVTGNVALASDYIFRGLTQSWGHPALQGGANYNGSNGFSAGISGSSISERTYPGGAMEADLFASYGTAIDSDWSWRAGVYSYIYPGANLDQAGLPSRSLNTVEANIALGWKIITLKYNRSLTDYFGVDREQGYRGDSKGTGYLQLDVAIPLGTRWSLALHAARTYYTTMLATPLANGAADPGYSDVGATVTYQFASHWSVSGGVTHAGNDSFYRRTSSFLDVADTRQVGGTRGFLMLQGAF